MKKIRTARIWCIIGILSMVLFAQAAWGTPLTVLNPSFEDPALSPGGYIYTISNWYQSETIPGPGHGESGVWYPAGGYFYVLPPDGNQFAFVVGAGTVISQTLSATLLPNVTYTLQVDLGSRLVSYPFPPGTSMALYAGSNLLASKDTAVPQTGYWTTDNLIFTSSANPTGLGQNLEIVFTSNGSQANFDNVRLDVTSVPIPPSLLLLGSGLLGLGAVGWRRRKPSGLNEIAGLPGKSNSGFSC